MSQTTDMYPLPITREDFEQIVTTAAKGAGVEFNEDTIIAAINYFHSLERNESTYDPRVLSGYLRRAYSSQMTYDWTTEIRHRREKEQAERQKAAPTGDTPLSLVETPANH